MSSSFKFRLIAVFLLSTLSAFGQYPGGSQPGGYHSSTGIAVGAAAAAGVGVGYLVLHNHNRGTVVGCLRSANGSSATLLEDDKKDTYTLINAGSIPLNPGERVALKGKRIRQTSGELTLEVHGLAKNYGSCAR